MAEIIRLESHSDPRIMLFTHLKDREVRRLSPEGSPLFIAETHFVIETAFRCGCRPYSLLIDERHLDAYHSFLATIPSEIPCYVLTRDEMSEVVGFEVTRGFYAAFHRPQELNIEALAKMCSKVLVLDGLVDVTNVGAIFRSAAALGCEGIILSHDCADPLNRRAVRVSMGTCLSIPWTKVSISMPECLAFLQTQGFDCCAFALTEQALDLKQCADARTDRQALVVGSEGYGLSEATLDACDRTCIIPMATGIDSLNVGHAVTLGCWEFFSRP